MLFRSIRAVVFTYEIGLSIEPPFAILTAVFCADTYVPVSYTHLTDNEALQRILKNLIDTAIRHGGDGKYISLRLTTSNGKNIIVIEDRGDGISPPVSYTHLSPA